MQTSINGLKGLALNIDVLKDNVTLKIKVKEVVRPTLKKSPLCGVRHYEPTNVCKLCKEKH